MFRAWDSTRSSRMLALAVQLTPARFHAQAPSASNEFSGHLSDGRFLDLLPADSPRRMPPLPANRRAAAQSTLASDASWGPRWRRLVQKRAVLGRRGSGLPPPHPGATGSSRGSWRLASGRTSRHAPQGPSHQACRLSHQVEAHLAGHDAHRNAGRPRHTGAHVRPTIAAPDVRIAR